LRTRLVARARGWAARAWRGIPYAGRSSPSAADPHCAQPPRRRRARAAPPHSDSFRTATTPAGRGAPHRTDRIGRADPNGISRGFQFATVLVTATVCFDAAI